MQGSAAGRPLHGSVHLCLISVRIDLWLAGESTCRQKGATFVPWREFGMQHYYPSGARGPDQSLQKQQILALRGQGCACPVQVANTGC